MIPRRAAALLSGLTFVSAAAGVWALRRALLPERSAPTEVRIQLPAGVRGSPATAPVAEAGPAAPLLSVSMGVLLWPEHGDPAAVNAAFADAWRRLRPSLPPAGESSGSAADDADKARQLFADWWKTDPEAALRFVSEPPGLLLERGGLFLLPLLAAHDPRLAWKLTDRSGDLAQRATAQQALLSAWAARAPEEAMAFVAALPAHQKLAAETAVLAAWPGEQALHWCAALPEGWRRQLLLRGVLLTAVTDDPAAVASAWHRGTVTATMLREVLATAGQDAADQLMRAAFATERDPLAVCLREMKVRHSVLAVSAWTALLEKSGASSPADIATLAASLPHQHSPSFLAALGRAAPEAGLAWALQHGVPPASLLSEWARIAPDAAIAALRGLPQTELARAARIEVAQGYSIANPAVAAAALENCPPGPEAGPVMRAAARGIARTDPVRALHLLHDAPGTTPEEVSVILAIGGRSDPLATSAALAESDLPVTDTVASESFIRGWGARDPAAASAWVQGLAPGELRDGGAAGLARIITESDPVSAFAWALEVAEPDMRARVLGSVYDEAVRRRLASDALMNDPRLTPEERGTLRARYSTIPAP